MRRLLYSSVVAVTVLGAVPRPAVAVPVGTIDWLPTLEKGLADAKQSGRAVLYVTLWKTGA